MVRTAGSQLRFTPYDQALHILMPALLLLLLWLLPPWLLPLLLLLLLLCRC
jgi:hypothetical protein